MNSSSRARLALLVLCGGFFGVSATNLIAPAEAQRTGNRKSAQRSLEIWPGQRVLLALPLTLGPEFNSGAELGQAIVPIIEPELRRALERTNKFSLTTPYRFDPVLRRAVIENRIADADVTTLVQAPTLENSQTVLSKLTFNQPAMIAEVALQELRVGGTAKAPTVQLQVTGRLHEVGGSGVFRTATVTSRPYGGATPEARLTAAARDAFNELALQFVAPPESFSLPAALTLPAPSGTATTPSSPATGTPVAPVSPVSNTAPVPSVRPPGALAPPTATPFVPILPPAQPPLGLNVPQEPTVR